MINKYLIEKDKEIDETILRQFLIKFQGTDLPRLSMLHKYYDGKQLILSKKATDTGKPCNKIVTNFTKYIVDTYAGYLSGIPIQYDNDRFENVIDILKWNDYINEDNELLTQALIFGKAFEVNYVDYDGKQKFRVLDARNCIDVYDNTLNNDLQYCIRFWEEELDANNQPLYAVEVYGPNSVKRYKSNAGFMSFWFQGEEPHYYGQCPITVFKLNNECKSIFEQIISLQDAYNNVVSGSIDDFDSFADAYLVLKGLTAEEDELANMKRNRALIMDVDCSAEYLTKNINDAQTLNIVKNLKDNIHKIANCPDFTDANFYSDSGIAIRYKLVGFETSAASIESNMRKALQRRIELICAILKLTNEEAAWRDCKITFTRNLPTDLSDTVQIINQLKGTVSERTLLSLLPFITDVDAELKQLEEEKAANIDMYQNFVGNSNGLLEEQRDNNERENTR